MEKTEIDQLQEVNQQLYNSMKAFQIAAEESGSLVFTYDTRKQTIFVDPRTARAFGVEEEQAGVPYEMVKLGVVADDSVEEYLRIHEAMIRGEKEAGGIVKLVQADGTMSVQELKFRAIINEDGSASGSAVGIYRNITNRYMKDMEEERFRQIVYASERYTFQYDWQEDYLVIYSPPSESGGIEVQYGYEDFSDRLEAGEICPEDDIVVLREVLQKGVKKPVQVRLYGAETGKCRWYGLTAKVTKSKEGTLQTYGLLSDLTDLKKKEDAYQKLERILRTMKNEYIGIFEVDIQNDCYTVLHYSGKLDLSLAGQGSYQRMIKLFAEKLAAPEFKERLEEFYDIRNLQEVLKQDKRVEFEYRTLLPGNPWYRCTFQVAEYRDGVPCTLVLYHSDIDRIKTEQLAQQQAVQEAYQYAESANLAKTDFLSRMSHDIRTPMNAIIGMTAIAGANLEDSARVKECLNKITAASRHLLGLINEVLDMSKIESGALELSEEKFNLADLVDNMIAMVMPQIKERGHALEVNVGNLKHEWVSGDSLRIQQAFVNLISNAVKYTPDGGRIYVSIEEKPSHSQNYGEYEFRFEDNGIGMSEEFQSILFEPFTRAEDSRLSKITGTGLGMTITRNLIRMMDGDIKVSSKLNEGSCFTVTIHLKIQSDDLELPGRLRDLPVLIVDDDEITCKSTCLILDEIGMKGEWCLSGREAVELVRDRHKREEDYFAVILDWKMPDMDGVETARRIRSLVGSEVPILFLTAYDWSEIEAEARAVGVDRFLSKPLFRSRLVTSFVELIEPEEEKDNVMPVFSEDSDFTGKRILLAEDNEINAEIGMELLRMTGAEVEWAENGKEAVTMIEQSEDGYYNMVFMDIQMPVMDGYDATKEIRSLNRADVKTLPVVAMTANAFAEDISHAFSAGMNDHIAKPVDMEQLENILRKYLT